MFTNQVDLLQFTIPPYSEEYFNAVHDDAERLMKKDEFEKALSVLDEVHDFIRKTDQTSQLGYILILQGVIHLVLYNIQIRIFFCGISINFFFVANKRYQSFYTPFN